MVSTWEGVQCHLTLANTFFLAYSKKKVVDGGIITGKLVHRLVANTKCGQSSYIDNSLFHRYEYGNLLINEEEIQ